MPYRDAGVGSSNGQTADSEDEYEYEYDENETETFYVDLDLSSLNGVIRPRLQSRKKLIPTATKTANPAATPAASTQTPTPAPAGTATANTIPGGTNGDVQPNTPAASKGTLPQVPAPGTEIQVLELGSYNPVISYQNEIYSCTWSDMIGTNMFFSEHDEEMEADPLRSTEDYDLLGISRVKLIGRKAKLTDKPGRKETYRNAANDLGDEGTDVTSGKGFGTIRASNPVTNRELKKQAKFLENLMDAKRTKGQTDNVRTVYKPSKAPREGTGSGTTVRGEQASSQEIEELNRRVVRGDADALRRLQIIYSEPEEQQSNGIPQASAPTPGSTWHGSVDRENSNPYQTENTENT